MARANANAQAAVLLAARLMREHEVIALPFPICVFRSAARPLASLPRLATPQGLACPMAPSRALATSAAPDGEPPAQSDLPKREPARLAAPDS